MNSTVWVVLVIVVIAVLAFVVMRGRGGAQEQAAPDPARPDVVAADPTTTPTTPVDEPSPAAASAADPAPAATPVDEPSPAPDPAPAATTVAADPPPAADRPPVQSRSTDSALAALDSGLVGSTAAAGIGSGATATPRTGSGPHAGSMLPGADGEPPAPGYTIKANAGSKRYHDPSSPYYVRTRADLWFRDSEDAAAAGFRWWKG